jgi:hypothetical protein
LCLFLLGPPISLPVRARHLLSSRVAPQGTGQQLTEMRVFDILRNRYQYIYTDFALSCQDYFGNLLTFLPDRRKYIAHYRYINR